MAETREVQFPEACTLPTLQQPVRLGEFDHLFATALRGQARLSTGALRWSFDREAEDAVRDLAARETACCSFFSFRLTSNDTTLLVEVEVPAAQSEVLNALAARAAVALRSS